MSRHPYAPPAFMADTFTCPHCGTYAQHRWFPSVPPMMAFQSLGVESQQELRLRWARCLACDDMTLWMDEQLVYPDHPGIPSPNGDLREDIQADYNEAASIVSKSPRGAVALLRLAIEKTCHQLGASEGNKIYDSIGELVAAGTVRGDIKEALDVIRVFGNNAIHPLDLDLTEAHETAMALFYLVNRVAEQAITEPGRTRALFQQLPKGARDAIEQRDS